MSQEILRKSKSGMAGAREYR